MNKKAINDLFKHYEFEMCEIYDQKALFTDSKIDPKHIPDGMYRFEVQSNEDESLRPTLLFNTEVDRLFRGTILSTDEFACINNYESMVYPLDIYYEIQFYGHITAEEYLKMLE